MSHKSKLIVKMDSSTSTIGLIVSCIMCLFLMGLLYSIHHSFVGMIPVIGLLLKVIFGGLIMLFLLGVIYGIYLMKTGYIFFILSDKGVWIRDFGFVAWQHIQEVGDYPAIMGKSEPRALCIRFKDVSAIAKQSNWQGKMRLFWSKLFGIPPITCSNLDVPIEKIVCFAKHYMRT